MYLDCDTTPPLKSKTLATKSPARAKRAALDMLGNATEGQIGVYDTYLGDGFVGYAIKYPGQTPYFEDAPADATA